MRLSHADKVRLSAFAALAAATPLFLAACGSDGPAGSNSPPPGGGGDAWASLALMIEPRQEVGVAAIGSRIFVAGGYRANGTTANTLEVYDVAANAWSLAAPMPVAVNHPGAAALDGRFYVIGGALASGASTGAVQEYDPARNEWGLKTPMPTARNAVVTGVRNGVIYVAGGAPGGRDLEAYDPAADRWETLPLMPTPRNHVAGGFVGDRLFAVGGRPPNTLATHEAFDAIARTWSARAALPTGRSGHGAAVVRGCLYVFGGEGNVNRPDGVFSQNEAYDPRTNSWETLTPMPTPRHGIGAGAQGDPHIKTLHPRRRHAAGFRRHRGPRGLLGAGRQVLPVTSFFA
jgi:N-acetylneuraminic acid mutarotase